MKVVMRKRKWWWKCKRDKIDDEKCKGNEIDNEKCKKDEIDDEGVKMMTKNINGQNGW
jgi:hypothetical protein